MVQALESRTETETMLALAADLTWIAGVIDWIDLSAQDAVAEVEKLVAAEKAVGMRNWPMIHPDPH